MITPAKIASFICGAFITGTVYLVTVFITFSLTFSLVEQTPAEQLTENCLIFFFSAFLTLLIFYIAVKQYIGGRKFTAAGIASVAILGLLATYFAGKNYFHGFANKPAPALEIYTEIKNPNPSQNNISAYP